MDWRRRPQSGYLHTAVPVKAVLLQQSSARVEAGDVPEPEPENPKALGHATAPWASGSRGRTHARGAYPGSRERCSHGHVGMRLLG